ncbi:MAG: AI-2E family transporter [Bacteroidetes bacterium]|nr:AI-2E family transporter [Bacteroidota bacterium]
METQSNLLKTTARLVIATLIVIVMVVGKSFLVPMAWALLIGLASYRFLNHLEEKTKLSRSAINSLFLFSLLLFLIGIGYFFYIELSHIFRDLPGLMQTISERLHEISLTLKNYGIFIPDHIDKRFISDWVHGHNDMIMNVLSGIGLNLWNIVLIMFYMFFLLYYRDLVIHFYIERFKRKERLNLAKDRFNKVLDLVRSYIFGLVLLTLISAVMNYAVFLVFGLKFALFWAVFLALLNLIPFIGNPIGLLVIMLFAIITKETMLIPILIFVALFVMNFLQDNVIRPWIVGDKLKINAFAVFVAIIIGGMVWGVSGMILFIPIVGVVKIILESNKESGVYAIFFSELPKNKKSIEEDLTMEVQDLD